MFEQLLHSECECKLPKIDNRPTFRFIIIGTSGIGKSTMLNNLKGGHSEVKVIDTPGFMDRIEKLIDIKKILKGIADKGPKADIPLSFHPFGRVNAEDVKNKHRNDKESYKWLNEGYAANVSELNKSIYLSEEASVPRGIAHEVVDVSRAARQLRILKLKPQQVHVAEFESIHTPAVAKGVAATVQMAGEAPFVLAPAISAHGKRKSILKYLT